jgi:ActR/RegA family two-component response regulator
VSVGGGDAPAPETFAGQQGDARRGREAGEPILVVDDDRDWCNECAFSLYRLGYEPLIAHSAADAMALFQENDVSVALVDYNMPEGDGISLIHALSRQAQEQGRPLSFIMATGYATKDVAIGAMRASVTDILEKPIDQNDLRAALQRIKGLRPSAPAREMLLDKISDLSSELQRLAQLMDTPEPGPAPSPTYTPSTEPAGELDQARLNAFIRDLLRREAKRREIGGGELFGDPTWAMLLDLLLAKFENRRISVSSACIASGAPMSTALRLVRRLVGEEVLVRLPDEHDRRRHFLVINPRLEQPLLDHIADQLRQDESRRREGG